MSQPLPPPEPPPTGTVTALILAAEAALAAALIAAYTAWLQQVTEAVLAAFTRFGLSPDPSAVHSLVPDWERRVEELMSDLAKMARQGWQEAARQLGVTMPFNATDPLLADQLQRTRNLLVRTPDEVYRMILRELGKGAALGETVAQQAQRVRQVLDATGTENWPLRARTVATTEIGRAYAFGALAAGFRAEQRLGGGVLKTWDAKEDSATRPEHKAADGQTVPVQQPFLLGLVPLMAPGDPSGPPHLVINCRCRPRLSRSAT